LLVYTTLHIMICNVKGIYTKILLTIFIGGFLLYEIFPNVVLLSFFYTKFVYVTIFYFIIIPLLTALEESLHIAVCIQQGKSSFVSGIVVKYIITRKKHLLAMTAVATKFRGNFKLSEKIQIHGGAPLLIFLFLCIGLVVGVILPQIHVKDIMWFWLILGIFPICSLLPIKLIFESDGYCILKDAKRLGASAPQTFKEILWGMFYGLQYIFLGSRYTRKFNMNVVDEKNQKILGAFEAVQKDNFKNAATILEEALKKNSDNPEIYNNIAWCYAELRTNLDRAIMLARKAIDLNPAEAVYYDTLCWCYYKSGNFDKAKDCVRLALKIDSGNPIFQDHLKEIENALTKNTPKNWSIDLQK